MGVLTPFNPSVGVLTHAMEIEELQAGFASRRKYIHVYIIYTYIYIQLSDRATYITLYPELYLYTFMFQCYRVTFIHAFLSISMLATRLPSQPLATDIEV